MGLTRLGVLGWPVAHSRSPAMHNAALRAVGPRATGATSACRSRPSSSPRPCAPCRARASPAPTSRSRTRRRPSPWPTRPPPAARAIGAANTLTFAPGGAIAADNTDAPGLLAALGDRRPRSALILGAGGSARAAAYALAQAGAAVAVWNRTPERARALAADLGVEAVGAPVAADVLVNCTSVGLTDPSSTFKELPVKADSVGEYACVVDLVYRTGGTVLAQEARRRGSQVIDGLEILVQQGALSFEGWTGRAAPVQVMREAARA